MPKLSEKEHTMPKLFVRTHDGTTFDLEVEDGNIPLAAFTKSEWIQFAGMNGKQLTIHAKTIHSILREAEPPRRLVLDEVVSCGDTVMSGSGHYEEVSC